MSSERHLALLRALPPALVAFALLTGCLGQPAADSRAEYGFSGVFMVTVLQDEIRELSDLVRAEGGEIGITTKIPPMFEARGLTIDACSVVADYLATKLFVEHVSGCEDLSPAPAIVAAAPVAPPSVSVASAPVGVSSF